jgi:hypothetical protein
MENTNSPLPPLKDITTSGTYILKLIKPKEEVVAKRFKPNAAGFASCRLFFLDGDGNCLTKNFTAQYGKGLAMVVGKFTGKYCPMPPETITVENLYRFVEPAFGRKATVTVEVTPDKEWQGRMQYRYKFTKIEPVAEVGYKPSPFAAPAAPAADEQPTKPDIDTDAIPF